MFGSCHDKTLMRFMLCFREKEEERLAKQRVRDQIEQDKLARKAKFGGSTDVAPSESEKSKPQAPPVAKPAQVQQHYSEVQLQLRLTNGAVLKKTFGAKEPLSAVRVYVELNRTDGVGPFSLMTSFPPRRVFEAEDYEKPLEALGNVNI